MRKEIMAAVFIVAIANPVAAFAQQSAVSCLVQGNPETYVIDDTTGKLLFYNKASHSIDQVCFGSCHWSRTQSRISFETDDGFIREARIDRVKGSLFIRDAAGGTSISHCVKIPFPYVAKNKF